MKSSIGWYSENPARLKKRGQYCGHASFARIFLVLWLAKIMLPGLLGADTNYSRRVEFLEPQRTVYFISPSTATNAAPAKSSLSKGKEAWIRALRAHGSTNTILFGDRIVVQAKPGNDLQKIISGRGLSIARELPNGMVILQATNSAAAIDAAEAIAKEGGAAISYPIARHAAKRLGRFAPAPNDPFFSKQWNLENRDTNGIPLGIDLNLREAWSVTGGEGIIVAVADDGIDLTHPDLAANVAGAPHHDFDNTKKDGSPQYADSNHGTAVSGLIGAAGNNSAGISGLAPNAKLASWVIWGSPIGGSDQIISDEALMEMFQYASNVVSVQNHSWGNASGTLSGIDALSDIGISNAVTHGRGGKGSIIVRAAGNARLDEYDTFGNLILSSMSANDDGFAADPRVISVAAVRYDGLFCSFSALGSCILVGAPSGDLNSDGTGDDPAAPSFITTDRQGSDGYNTSDTSGAGLDYFLGSTNNLGFNGTSASTPQISGIAALMLSANTNLTYRDVQQILLQSSHYLNTSDGDLHTNAAGFTVGHNLGYGVPDAGFAVALAKHWSNRPAATEITFSPSSTLPAIPTNALRVVAGGTGIDAALTSISCLPSDGVQANETTAILPLVDVGQALTNLTVDLHGKAALIKRGVNYFEDKIKLAAQAGAAFAIIYNNVTATNGVLMQASYAPIPGVFISKESGEALQAFVASHPDATAQIAYTPSVATFEVTNTLSCEHVGLKLTTTSTSRGDLHISLVSPAGTRSVLQRINSDNSQAPEGWVYWSVHHFYESSFGQWRLEIGNELSRETNAVTEAQLIIQGVPIVDIDHDGLDDNWEMAHFGTLAYGLADDPDGDGYSNAREQCLNTNPNARDPIMGSDISFWDDTRIRVALPAAPGKTYNILATSQLRQTATVLTNIIGHLPEVDVVVPYQALSNNFYYAVPIP